MPDSSEKREEWSEGYRKEVIVDQRKYLWSEDQVKRLALSMRLSPGMTVIDVGCGQGYLGWTYWKYYGKGGTYVGIDHSTSLLEEAEELADEWAEGGRASFLNGDCYDLPLPDGISDVTMCQTLLMHLEFPEQALGEMIRITRPGGVVMCKEPDNVSSMMKLNCSTAMDESLDEFLLRRKMLLIWARGRKKLGKGDWGVGPRIPMMMSEHGLTEICAVFNEIVRLLQHPYDTPEMKHNIEMLKKGHQNASSEEKGWKNEFREGYVAGGGSESTFYRNYRKLKILGDSRREKMIQHLDNGSLYICPGGSSFLCITGRKPV